MGLQQSSWFQGYRQNVAHCGQELTHASAAMIWGGWRLGVGAQGRFNGARMQEDSPWTGSTNAGRSGTSSLTFPAAATFEAFSFHPPLCCCRHGCHSGQKSEGQPQTAVCAAAVLYPCTGEWQAPWEGSMPTMDTCFPSREHAWPLWTRHAPQDNTDRLWGERHSKPS